MSNAIISLERKRSYSFSHDSSLIHVYGSLTRALLPASNSMSAAGNTIVDGTEFPHYLFYTSCSEKKAACSMHVKSPILNSEQRTFSPLCNMISHVFLEEYLARQQFEVFVQWNVIPINSPILWTVTSDHSFTARGSMRVSRPTFFAESFA